MAHPVPASRSLDFFLDLGNFVDSVGGGVVTYPPQDEEWWESQGEGTHYGVEFAIFNASQTTVAESAVGAGTIYWDSVELGLENGPNQLTGFKVNFMQYMEIITKTPIFGDPGEDGEPGPIIGYLWNGTRTYPEAGLNSALLSCSMDKVTSLWPRQLDTPAELAWRDRVFGVGRNDNWSTNIRAPEFEGVSLFGCDQATMSPSNPGTVGIVQGTTQCLGIVTTTSTMDANLFTPGGYYIEEASIRGFVRVYEDKIEPLVSINNGVTGEVLPIEGGAFAGRVSHLDELPFSTEDVPIPIGATYIEELAPRLRPFPEYIGQFLWTYVGVIMPDPEDPERPPLDRNFEPITDFRWERSTSIGEMSGYIYPLVFDEAIFSYIQRLAGPFLEDTYVIEPAITGLWYPTEPLDPEAQPYPIYPMDAVPAFVPDERETIDVSYSLNVIGALGSGSISWKQTCIAPNRPWKKMLKALIQQCYYTHGVPRSYATVPGYCNTESGRFGENFTDPFCVNERGEYVIPWIDEDGNPIPINELERFEDNV